MPTALDGVRAGGENNFGDAGQCRKINKVGTTDKDHQRVPRPILSSGSSLTNCQFWSVRYTATPDVTPMTKLVAQHIASTGAGA
jgi:hypothetical protein